MTALQDIDDVELMSRVAHGSNPAFAQLVERFTPMVYSLAYRMFPQRADADDIAQEAFLKIWNKAELYDETRGASVSTWIYRLVYNLCIDFKRKEKFKTTELHDFHESGEKKADEVMQDDHIEKIVRTAVLSLPERQRDAMILCHFEGLSNAEAAEIMDTSVKAVEGLLVRARKALHKDLESQKETLIA